VYFAGAWLGAIASRSTPARFRSAEIADIIGRSGATRLLAVRSAAEPFPSLRSCFFAAFNPAMDKIAAEAGRRGVSLSGLAAGPDARLAISNALICNRWPTRQVALRLRCRMPASE